MIPYHLSHEMLKAFYFTDASWEYIDLETVFLSGGLMPLLLGEICEKFCISSFNGLTFISMQCSIWSYCSVVFLSSMLLSRNYMSQFELFSYPILVYASSDYLITTYPVFSIDIIPRLLSYYDIMKLSTVNYRLRCLR